MRKLLVSFIILLMMECISCKTQNHSYVHYYQNKKIQIIDYREEKIAGFESNLPYIFDWEVQIPSEGYLLFGIAFKAHQFEKFPHKFQILVKEIKKNSILFKEPFAMSPEHIGMFHFKVPLKGLKNKLLNLRFELISLRKNQIFSNAVIWETPKIFSEARSKKPNVIIITIDALRADHLGCYGYPNKTSPSIDKFARNAFKYTNAYSTAGSTWPSLTTLMTSTYPSQHGVIFNGYQLQKNLVSVPEIMQQNGYQTFAFLANMKRGTHKGYNYLYRSRGDKALSNVALQVVNLYKDTNFFIWIHYLGPHAAYEAPDEYLARRGLKHKDLRYGRPIIHNSMMKKQKKFSGEILQKIIKLYDADIEYTDHLVGTLLDEITKLGLKENTIIIISADHGEELAQHFNYLYHSGSLYDSTLRIPLLWYIPSSSDKQKSTDDMISMIDIAPTLLSYLHIKVPASFKGVDVMASPENKSPENKWVFSEEYGKIYTLRDQRYRYIINPGNEEFQIMAYLKIKYDEQLFLHPTDEKEYHTIIAQNPSVAHAYHQLLTAWIHKNLPASVPPQTIDEQTKEQLRALGYVNP